MSVETGTSIVNVTGIKELILLENFPKIVLAFGGGHLIKLNIDGAPFAAEEQPTMLT